MPKWTLRKSPADPFAEFQNYVERVKAPELKSCRRIKDRAKEAEALLREWMFDHTDPKGQHYEERKFDTAKGLIISARSSLSKIAHDSVADQIPDQVISELANAHRCKTKLKNLDDDLGEHIQALVDHKVLLFGRLAASHDASRANKDKALGWTAEAVNELLNFTSKLNKSGIERSVDIERLHGISSCLDSAGQRRANRIRSAATRFKIARDTTTSLIGGNRRAATLPLFDAMLHEEALFVVKNGPEHGFSRGDSQSVVRELASLAMTQPARDAILTECAMVTRSQSPAARDQVAQDTPYPPLSM